MAPTASLVPKGRHGYTTRTQTRAQKGATAKSARNYDESSSSDEDEPIPSRLPVKKRRKTRAKAPPAVAAAAPEYSESSDDDSSEEETTKPPARRKTRPSSSSDDEEVGEPGEFDHYFGDEAIGDPEEDLVEDYEDGVAVEKLTTTKKPYSKIYKQEIFRDALSIKKSHLLGKSPPPSIASIYETWSVTARRNYKQWDISTIARPMYLLGKFIARRIGVGALRVTDDTAPIGTLFTLYKHFSTEALQEIEKKKALTRRILAKATSTKSAKKDKLVPRHINPITAPRSTLFTHCPQCECEGTVVEVYTEEELDEKVEAWQADYEERKRKNEKARRTGEPQQLYACMCFKSKTMRGDWQNSSCLACRKRGAADPNCKNCNCTCPHEVFTQGEAQQKAITGMMQRNNAAKAQSSAKNGDAILGAIIQKSVGAVAESLKAKAGAVPHNKEVMTMVADQLKHEQFASEEDMHAVQQIVGPPTTKLLSGEDARSVLVHKHKKQYQNNLR